MPIVTGPPILPDAVNYSRQTGAEVNPFLFKIGTALYLVLGYSLNGAAIGVYKSTDGGSTWAEQDTAHHPTTALQAYAFLDGTTIRILLNNGGARTFQIIDFDTVAELWGTAGTALHTAVPGSSANVVFYKQTGGTFVAIFDTAGLAGTALYYATYSGGTWSSFTSLNDYGITVVLATGFAGVSDVGYFAYFLADGSINYNTLSLGFSLGTPIALGTSDAGSRGTTVLNTSASGSIAFAFTDTNQEIIYTIGTPLASPTFTRTTVATTVGAASAASFATLKVNSLGQPVILFVYIDYADFPSDVDQMLMTTLISGSWTTSVVYYDEVANPPANSTTQDLQFIHTLDFVQLDNGNLIAATAMEIDVPMEGEVCAGFVLVPSAMTVSCRVPAKNP